MALLVGLMLIASMVLAACGGDDDDDEATPTAAAAAGTATTGTSATTPTTGSGATTATTGGEATATTEPAGTPTEAMTDLSGEINIDGSSTVFPITQAVAEEFNKVYGDVQLSVGFAGTGGGFEKFCAGEIQISDASRPISDEEIALCDAAGIEFIELPVAIDGLSVVVNPENDWVECLTTEQLALIWGPDSTIDNWNQVDPSFPDQELVLYGPGTDSGTFDYFTGVINGEAGASRADFTASEDDNVLVQGVEGDEGALGYFGYAYYAENTKKLGAAAIDGGKGPIAPSEKAVEDGSYQPLSRPIFIYVSEKALEKPEVKEFVDFYMKNAAKLVKEAYRLLKKLSKKNEVIVRLTALPGVSWIRAATLYAYLDTPWRFKHKQALWKYMGIGLVRKTSGKGPELLRVERAVNRRLKSSIIGAAQSIIKKNDSPFAEQYRRWVKAGLSAKNARRNVARSLGGVAWGMWKSGAAYDPDRVGVAAFVRSESSSAAIKSSSKMSRSLSKKDEQSSKKDQLKRWLNESDR
jgi:phosphate transport system substrate-binding protein